ncbi:MAG: hypothetical protein U5K27_14435 [Desulfotignum sp.]|nr:hypothetical protein [Desulfotignum sp.]
MSLTFPLIIMKNVEVDLGYDFATDEFIQQLEGIADCPDMWPVFHEDIQRRLVNRFPYAIPYSNEVKFIYILAVMHLSQ